MVFLNPDNLSEPPETHALEQGEAGTDPPSESIADIASDLTDRMLLTIDDSSGSPVLFSSSADGSNRQRLWDIGSDLSPAFMPGSTTDLLVPHWVPDPDSVRLEVRSVTGELIEALTSPGTHENDFSPAIAGDVGLVYFVRTYWSPPVDGTQFVEQEVLMSVPLDGSEAEVEVPTPIELSSVSVSQDGSVIAGGCQVVEGPTQGCFFSPGDDTITPIPGSEGSTMSDIEVSPDGRWIAFSSYTENPHGDSQVYVYDIENERVTALSSLLGANNQPAWAPESELPCLAFSHSQTGEQSVHIGCLTPDPVTIEAVPVGKSPVWFYDE
jgi:hypothetical protein